GDEDLDTGEAMPPDDVEALAEAVEIDEVEELEEADEAEIVQGIEPLPGDEDLDTGKPMPAGDLEDLAEAVDFDEVEELEEADEAEVVQGIEPLPGDQGLDTGEAMPAADLEDLAEAVDFDEVEELEEVDESQVTAEAGEALAGAAQEVGPDRQVGTGVDLEDVPRAGGAPAPPTATDASPLEILSEYLEPPDALALRTGLLDERQEDYVAQILERFTPRFVHIPAGTYTVGNPHPRANESGLRQVTLPSFHLGQYPVTNDLFELFVRDTGYETEAERAGFGLVHTARVWQGKDERGRAVVSLSRTAAARRVAGACWRHPQGPGSSLANRHNHPVTQVSRQDAMAFAAWAGKRLPSEEEWEAAARGPDGRLFPWGDLWVERLGNFELSRQGGTTAVSRFGPQAASPFAICDLLGNVWEWTSSPWGGEEGGSRPGRRFLLKGGCWTSSQVVTIGLRLTEREDVWSDIYGFRCAV
ncbi:MAG: SUMF1/EgtB/PvdO family nonheme iron enzyme, partial [Thermodesulfobacteriota bacterium]